MASEILSVPEEYLNEVIKVIRTGLKGTKVSAAVKKNLVEWCNEEEEYLKELNDDGKKEKKDNRRKSSKAGKKSS